MTDVKRVVIWFSAGVTSAIAAKLAVDKYRGVLPVHLVNTDTGSEDADNYRFMADVARWLDLPLEVIKNDKFEDTFSVYRKYSFFKNNKGARCTLELKRKPRREFEDLESDLQVFGFDADEPGRADDFRKNNPEVNAWFPLLGAAGITKDIARQMLATAGIREPRTYGEGFKNANCLARGCVKGGIGYWNHIRKVRPGVFANMAALEREIGYALLSLESRRANGERIKMPVYLDELDPTAGNYSGEPAYQCSLFCEVLP